MYDMHKTVKACVCREQRLEAVLKLFVFSSCDRGCSSVARESEFKSKDPGFGPLAGQGENSFSVSPSQLLCRQNTAHRVKKQKKLGTAHFPQGKQPARKLSNLI